MINPTLVKTAENIGYDKKTIDNAVKLTIKASSVHPKVHERYLFTAALFISSRFNKDAVLTSTNLAARYSVKISTFSYSKYLVLRSNNIMYVGSDKKSVEIPKNEHKCSIFDDI